MVQVWPQPVSAKNDDCEVKLSSSALHERHLLCGYDNGYYVVEDEVETRAMCFAWCWVNGAYEHRAPSLSFAVEIL